MTASESARTRSRVSLDQEQAELVALSCLASGPLYGYALAKRVAAISGGEIKLGPGVLYPLLARLENAGLVRTSWEEIKAGGKGPGETGRRRKWYRLTPRGKRRLEGRVREHRARLALMELFIGQADGPGHVQQAGGES